jgi:hypothetical protein
MAMIAIAVLALLAVAWRIRIRVFSRVEIALLSLVIVNWVMIWAQINVADGVAFPEKRYWIQSFVLICGWAVWGVDSLARFCSRRNRIFRYIIPVALLILVLFDMVMLFKPHIPLGRRYAYAKACVWAENIIKNDWDGPKIDKDNPFSVKEYHLPCRPIVHAFSQRLAYDLKGRRDNVKIFGNVDTPDYIVIDKRKEEGPKQGYEKLATRTFASRDFEIYRRKNDESIK